MDGRVEAAVFACARPVLREDLARVVGASCNIELILDDISRGIARAPLRDRRGRTRLGFGEAIRAALGGPIKPELSKPNAVVLMGIAYFQPITRGERRCLRSPLFVEACVASQRDFAFISYPYP
jgi:segregation and condensation protein B